jgi:hypothetical protein
VLTVHTFGSFPTRAQVETANVARLNALRQPTSTFTSVDTGSDTILSTMSAPAVLDLCVGAQVMYLKNRDTLLCNGRVGIVVEMVADHRIPLTPEHGCTLLPLVEFIDPEDNANPQQILIKPEVWQSVDAAGVVRASRSQVLSPPLARTTC